MSMKMIVTENLTRRFGKLLAVDSLTFHIDRGEVFGLLGPNGAGKSTVVRMLCCLIAKSSGEAMIADWNTADRDDAINIRRSIGYVPDSPGLYESMSVMRNLEYFARLYRVSEDLLHENAEKYLKLLGMWDWRDKDVSTFSKGMKQKVAIVRALVHDPDILVMDEPTANLDPEVSKTIRDLLLDLKKDNRTILLNTHNLDEAQRICTRIGLLKTRLLAMDSPGNLGKSAQDVRTEIVLNRVSDSILAAVRTRGPKAIDVDGARLVLELSEPEKERPAIVAAIVAAGGEVQTVTETGTSLEDVYLELVRE